MGRPIVPTHLKLLRGNPGKRRIPEDEPQPIIPESIPEPPPPLTGYAEEEWRRVAAELYRLQLLTIADINPLAAYCQAYKRWREAEETIAGMASNLPLKGLMVRNRDGELVRNPIIGIARNAAADMVRYAAEFGLTPAARARIAAGPFAERRASKFEGLLAG